MSMSPSCLLICLWILVGEAHGFKPTLQDYCKYNSNNTPCATSCHRSKSCGNDVPFQTLTDLERDLLLKGHNFYRNAVALGTFKYLLMNVRNTTLPPAEDMHVLSYDLEAEFLAGCHAKQCALETAKASISARGVRMNQELYTVTTLKEFPGDGEGVFVAKIIPKLLDNFAYQDFNVSDVLQEYKKRYGLRNMAQVLWSRTQFFGCAKMYSSPLPGIYTHELYCNYFPPGNIEGQPVYTYGISSCKTDHDYPYLCGHIRPLTDDHFVPPCDLNKATTGPTSPSILITILTIFRSIRN